MGFFQGTQNEFETAMVNEPSVFEPLKFYCMSVAVWGDHTVEVYSNWGLSTVL